MNKFCKYIIAALALLAVSQTKAEGYTKWHALDYMDDIAFLQSNDPDDPEEQAALRFFKDAYPNAQILTPEKFMSLDIRNSRITMIWIHANRGGIPQGWQNIAAFYTVAPEGQTEVTPYDVNYDPYAVLDESLDYKYSAENGMNETEFITKLKAIAKFGSCRSKLYEQVGLNLYFSGLAAQFIEGIGRVHKDDKIDVYGDDKSKISRYSSVSFTGTWSISPWIKNTGNPDHAGFASYGQVYDDFNVNWGHLVPLYTDGNVHPLMGADGTIYVSDNNCMWGDRNISDFDKRNRAVVQGTWGHLTETLEVAPIALVEFLRDNQGINNDWHVDHSDLAKPGFASHIVVNGIAACQWQVYTVPQSGPQTMATYAADDYVMPLSDQFGVNKHQEQLENFTFNTINYLSNLTDEQYVTTGIEDVDIDNEVEVAPEYYTLGGVRVSCPESKGIYIKRTGNKVEKIIVR